MNIPQPNNKPTKYPVMANAITTGFEIDMPRIDLGDIIHEHLNTLIKEVLGQLLKREPVPEDAKDITIGSHSNDPTKPLLIAYRGVHIGNVITRFSDVIAGSCTIKFYPVN